MLSFWRISLLVLGVFLIRNAQAEDAVFLSALNDVPLMVGLDESIDSTVYFDTPAGRIVEVFAEGDVRKDRILSYYKESLPPLGWKFRQKNSYVREGEDLSISVKMDGKIAVVRFALSPNTQHQK